MRVRRWVGVLLAVAACGGGGNLGTMEQDFPCDYEGRCPGGLVCTEKRQCVPGAPACEKATCGTQCVNLQTDEDHCGACDKKCAASETCKTGVCMAGPQLGCQFGCGQGICVNGACACAGNGTFCNFICADITQSAISCGTCGEYCIYGGQVCRAGKCACPPGEKPCGTGTSLSCEATLTDPNHCGACNNKCPSGQKCDNGACVAACATANTCSDGKCWNTAADPAHCGSTCKKCPDNAACDGGACECPTGSSLCGTSACNDLQRDPTNCGTCGKRCAAGEQCVAGACVCQAGLTLCGTACVDVKSDPANCGACGTACPSGQSCTATGCQPACPAGTMACSGACADFTTDEKHCGSCTKVCSAGEQCIGGECQQWLPAVGCSSCPCDFCDLKKNWLCCPRPEGITCQEGTFCP